MKWLLPALMIGLLAEAVIGAAPQSAGRLVFVGTYTHATSKGIYAFRFDDRTGALTPLGLAAETPSPSFLVASADGRYVYAVNELESYQGAASGSVTAFAVDAAHARLTPIDVVPSRGTDPCHLALDRSGRFLAVANYTSGTFAILPVGQDGALHPAMSVLTHAGSGPNQARQQGPHAHEVVFSKDNHFLLGVDLGLDSIFSYKFDQATGAAAPNDPPAVKVAPGAGPRHLVFHPDGRHAFVVDEMGSTVTSLNWNGTKGQLAVTGTPVSTLPDDFHGSSTGGEIAIHPNGRVLYTSNRGDDSIAVFTIGPTGALRRVQVASTRGKTPRHFTLDPTGRWLLAANQDSGSIGVFRVDPGTGALAPAGPLSDLDSAVCILFMP
jgi:6-phosphogluconolactonase